MTGKSHFVAPVAATLVLIVVGCPGSNATSGNGTDNVPPQPIATTAPTLTESAVTAPAPTPPSVTMWSVHVTSEAPGLNPDMFDTPEKKAKVFFDHLASANGGKVTVEHETLGETSEVDADAAAALDQHMTSVDWAAVSEAVKADGATEGGTVFRFAITVGGASWTITTTHLEKHADLAKVVDAVKAATGRP